ncbi:hypothetical protein HNR16_001822 [Pseudoclavibacter chungangensis]|uniref:DUF222 domain-containing protein n=1 Tax=Pseudoclavibacter chungangensis TaxID=587635 RepID=UPI0015CDD988|nr:hypothetical protein [Pseudoclavibacter chungangensis]
MGLLGEVLSGEAVRGESDEGVLELAVVAGELLRRVEGLVVEVAGEVQARSAPHLGAGRLSSRRGCRSVNEVLRRATGTSAGAAARWLRAASAVRGGVDALSGEVLEARCAAVRGAMVAGHVGVEGVLACTGALLAASARADAGMFRAADAALAGEASGPLVLGPRLGRADDDAAGRDAEAASDADPDVHDGADGDGAADAEGRAGSGGGVFGVRAGRACAEQLRVQARVWSMVLDQDGAEPCEQRALRRRGLRLGVAREGLVPISGHLLIETAAQLRLIDSALAAPRAGDGTPGPDGHAVRFHPTLAGLAHPSASAAHDARGDGTGSVAGVDADAGADARGGVGARHGLEGEFGPVDDRTRPQLLHDAFTTALRVAAAANRLPTMGGAAPVLVVQVRERDLVEGRGWAYATGQDEPVPLATARHTACAGIVQRVTLDDHGQIRRIGTQQRVFDRDQRRAIALRDGGCLIPGCGTPAAWCEIHHVTEHAHGGPTHTDNGVLLCWYHHRNLDRTGWQIRMNHGTPELKPPHWYDPHAHWHPHTTAPLRHTTRLNRRA